MPDGHTFRVIDRRGAMEIFLHGDIVPGMAEGYARELKAAAGRPVLVRVHSAGGDWLEASAMFAATQAHPGLTTALVEGLAASSASFLLQAFNKRRIAQNALLMVHAPHMTASGRAEDHDAAATVLRTVRSRLAAAYARSGQPATVIEGWLAGESWFDANEALSAGLVDAIDQPARAAAHPDLSQFSSVPARIRAALTGRGSVAQGGKMDPITLEPATPDATALIRSAYQSAERLGIENSAVDALIDDGVALAQVPERLIEIHARRAADAAPAQRLFASPSGAGSGDPARVRSRMAGALFARLTGREPEPESREYRGLSAIAMARETLEAGGTRTRLLSDAEIVDRVLNAGLHTRDDFPALLTESGTRALLASYDVAASAFKTVSRRSDAPDFRPISRIRFGNFPGLQEVLEHGEVTFGSSQEAKESYSVKTYARSFGVTRQSLINDDLSALADFTRLAGRAAAEAEAGVFIALLAQNSGAGPTLSDGDPLFHANHGNLAGAGGAINVTTLAAARKAIRDQKGLDGSTPIGGTPRYLLVGNAKETEGEQVLAALSPTQLSNVNPFSGRLELLVEPRLAGNVWYVFCDAGSLPVLEYAYLQGQQGPRLKVMEQATVLGVVFQVVHDFGAGVLDHRGCFKNPGA